MKWMAFILILIPTILYGQQSIAFLNLPKTEVVSLHSNKPANSDVIPIEIIRGMIYLEAELNGTRGLFILDTGAPTLILNQSQATGPEAGAMGLNANIQVVETMVRSFKLGTLQQNNIEALALDLSHLERASGKKILGLIGYDVFENSALLLDFDQKKLFLTPSSQKIEPSLHPPLASLFFTLHDHLPIVKVRIGGKVLQFGIDTGAARNLLDEKFLHDQAKLQIEFLPNEEIQGLDQNVKIVRAGLVEVSSNDELPFGKNKFLFTDLSFLREHTGCQIDGLLGSPFLANADFTIDYPKRRIEIWEQ